MNNLNNNFTYKGVVSIKRNLNGKLIETTLCNEGKNALFKLLCKALCGYSVAADVPAVFQIRDRNDKNLLNRRIGLSSPSYLEENGEWKARFLVNITNRDTSSEIAEAETMVLCDSKGNVLASIDIRESSLKDKLSIDNNQTLIIQWDMIFRNPSEKEETEKPEEPVDENEN